MNLPDGTGLDLVRFVRASATWKATPFLILSGDVDPKKVSKAYALGANAYVDKSPHGRTMSDVLRSLYQHWGQDAVLPIPARPERIQRIIMRGMSIRRRHAELYQRLAELFADRRAEAAFWLSRALAEANLINLLGFLQQQLHDRELADGIADQLEAMQIEVEGMLRDGERQLAERTITRDAAYRLVIDLIETSNLRVLSTGIGHLFPSMSVAMEAVHDFLVGTVHDVAAWVDLHASDAALRAQAAQMRAQLAAYTVATPARA
jgi:CheY-like chemotaxis protein